MLDRIHCPEPKKPESSTAKMQRNMSAAKLKQALPKHISGIAVLEGASKRPNPQVPTKPHHKAAANKTMKFSSRSAKYDLQQQLDLGMEDYIATVRPGRRQ